jgi:hypothetical protein
LSKPAPNPAYKLGDRITTFAKGDRPSRSGKVLQVFSTRIMIRRDDAPNLPHGGIDVVDIKYVKGLA